MVTLYKDQFGQLTHDAAKKFVRFDWFPATFDMTNDDFKRSHTVVAEAVLAHSVESILVDVHDFSCMSAMEDARFVMEAWRSHNVITKSNKVFKRLAWLAGDKLPKLCGGGYAFRYEDETFQTCWFRDEAAAASWATTTPKAMEPTPVSVTDHAPSELANDVNSRQKSSTVANSQ